MGAWQRTALRPGIYDELVTDRLAAELGALDPSLEALCHAIGEREDLTNPLGALLRGALDVTLAAVSGRPADARALAEAVLAVLRAHAPTAIDADEVRLRAERLRSIVQRPARSVAAPRGSLHVSSLLVNAEGASLLEHLRSEFDSADRVDLLCAFVKLSGFEKLRAAFEHHCSARGRPLRVLTTTYLGASDLKAIQRLAALPHAEVKVSFDEQATRLHAKAWVFHRDSGYSTAYVGSSNLSHAAQTDGLEWNVRATASDQPVLVAQMAETFEQYWADATAFERVVLDDATQARRLTRALSPRDDRPSGFLPELEPKDFQRPILEELADARRRGRHRNLLVAATGTGKTVMAALDYQRLRRAGQVETLLFVAHRREILQQARETFRAALQLPSFGELLYDGHRPEVGRHVFASIDSLGTDGPIDPAQFDHVVLDEAHHSAADSWTELLDRVAPRELVGLTGTPERADGLDYERAFPRPWVGNLRLWNAIPHALVPFRYYALDVPGVDLRSISWRAGRYAPEALAGTLLAAADIHVLRAVDAVTAYISRPHALRALAFCASVAHAEAVDRRFRAHGFASQVLTGATEAGARERAKGALAAGDLQILCVVDLYNEGVDIPNVNTIFFFRPTESATVFLQQLGRGLRRAADKAELVVFDLTGRQHLQFRFDRRLRAALGHTPRALRELVDTGFGRLPAGCHLHFDERARADILAQLRRAIPSDRSGLLRLLQDPTLRDATLAGFLHETDVALADLYPAKQSWTLLRQAAGLDTPPLADGERAALETLPKLLHVGDTQRLDAWRRLLDLAPPTGEPERRLARMLFAVLYGKEIAADDARSWALWRSHDVLRAELAALAPLLRQHNALLEEPHRIHPDVPLTLHGRYLGVELSAAFDQRSQDGHFRDYYTGVEATGGGRYDLLLVTLEKSAATKEHLRYRDYPLHTQRFHWQSKGSTRRDSPQGRRHLEPEATGCTSLLLVRERSDDRPGVTMAFQYLGPVRPDGDSGERPITVEWALDHAMPRALVVAGRVAG
jgi:superfamily II DNA or RNA helicase/HKD family nuclease